MASKLSLAFLLLVFLSILPQPTISTVAQETNRHDPGLNVGMISSILSNKGYLAMSLILEQILPTLIPFEVNHNTTITIFCPLDKAFLSSKYPQPPFTLLQYHVAPLRLDREALQSSLPYESKVDTLLPHHPLVITTTPHHSDRASINGVKVTDWDIYNNGHVIVHGVEDFFDPAFQTLLYPWYDGRVTKNEIESRTGKDSNTELGRLSWVKEMMMEQKFFVVMAVLVFAGSCISLACLRRWNRQYGGYAHRKPDDGILV
ncbi:putative fasciclin-like arabinogalactan protein 20 [Camellia lanceoleosa]|uniref:Fasciclin-like arabinogalactan protein 20 n=1 Tax=Camellia lanceoleosa TaxID=1840588 RepID=A0ACC0HZQ4_9ERIC|nr:putative fasciclin-like arabinogalactan protein 20 [Camellia lanceoleosa]